MSAGSYITSTFSQDISDEIRRLGVQVDLFWEEEKRVYDEFTIPSGARILEIGSGPGFYIKKLAGIFPDASFVSFEYDEDFSAYQKELFKGELGQRVDIVNGDIMTAEGLGEFDLVVSRMVLEHLPEPVGVFAKMSAFVKQGGRFLLLDNDFSNHLRTYPRVPELDDLYDAYCNMRLEQGGNPYIGRELPRYFSLGGYEDVNYRTVSAHTYKIDKSLFLGAESSAIGMTLVKQGYLDTAIFKKLILNWSRMAHDPANVMVRDLYCAHGVKSEAGVGVNIPQSGTGSVAPLSKKPASLSVYQGVLVAPSSEREKQLAGVWCELLNIEEVSTDVSFFDVGGESYMVPLLVDALENRFQVEIEITDIFEYPTITGLAAYIDTDNESGLDSVVESVSRQRSAIGKNKGESPFARLKK